MTCSAQKDVHSVLVVVFVSMSVGVVAAVGRMRGANSGLRFALLLVLGDGPAANGGGGTIDFTGGGASGGEKDDAVGKLRLELDESSNEGNESIAADLRSCSAEASLSTLLLTSFTLRIRILSLRRT